ncbi:MAG TPA: DEAD/DEAH box helicase [Candidatus Paceibacterota bacterium]|nr:DEAD/DEAH box helicase [Verrucomicrobiota bacterium]HRZ47297.1 DEAD/DEAH box helicase [Candidatus Paceibacterota bacterium]HSA12241.1 DEAD/DEAH box helicase [Candidatus Paceibacterota bacterium]
MQTNLCFEVGEANGSGKFPFTDADYEAVADSVLTPENRFHAAALAGRNCFLTGAGGTGKSTQLRAFIAECPRRVSVTAPTGVAALNVGGMTIHRFCGMLIGPAAGQSSEDYFAQLQRDPRRSILAGFNRVRRCEVLVIDEVSMLPGRQLEFVEFLFRRLRGRDEPFGGCQVIASGDFLQLPPVRTGDTEPYDWGFQSPAWAAAEFRTFLLEKVRRQDEAAFVRALADFRVGRVWGDSARILQSRVRSNPPSTMPRLFTHNVQVDKWNVFQLSELPGEETVLHAEQSGPDLQRAFLTRNLLTPAALHLKPGALVMFTVNKNEPNRAEPLFVNGQIGTVTDVEPGAVVVESKTGGVIRVERFTWRYAQDDPESATFSQFPLRLAWAMTIHKAQGLTLDSAYLDIRAAREPGQAYVAVSRVRSLAGLNFKEWFKGVHVSPEAIEFYRQIEN